MKTLAIYPTDSVVHNNMGFALRNQGRYEEAVTCCKKALAIDPNYASAYYNMGKSLYKLGRFE